MSFDITFGFSSTRVRIVSHPDEGSGLASPSGLGLFL